MSTALARRLLSPIVAAATLTATVLAMVTPAAADDGPGPSTGNGGPVRVVPFEEEHDQVGSGQFTRVYDPSVGESEAWYVNDHTFARDRDGTWHLFGITHAEPANPGDEDHLAHATAPALTGPWTKQPFALDVDPAYGETHLWAPYVITVGDTYYMFYAGGPDGSRAGINLATSTDMFHWTRHPGGTLFFDGFDARDPYVTRIGEQWVMYYTANSAPTGGNHIVAYRTSTDLVHWGERQVAFTDPSSGTFGGPTESPFVQRRGDDWYLFIGPRGGYVGTDVFRSSDPFAFSPDQQVGHVDSHAAEVVADGENWYVSHAGWGQGGVYLAPLNWTTVERGVRVRAPGYHATVRTAPSAALTELAVPTADGGWQNLLESRNRGTVPYLAVGGFGATDRPGAPARVTLHGRNLTLHDVPLGNEPVTVDWTFRFDRRWFDTSLNWQVRGATTAPVWEVALSVDTVLEQLGDNVADERAGDAPGFPQWTLASGDTASVAVAYRDGSAWAEKNRWYSPSESLHSWQPLWQPGGQEWSPGRYAGGTWRIGASTTPADRTLAARLYDGLNEQD